MKPEDFQRGQIYVSKILGPVIFKGFYDRYAVPMLGFKQISKPFNSIDLVSPLHGELDKHFDGEQP